MKTSYFAMAGSHESAVSICLIVPTYYSGRQYHKLAPTKDILFTYKRDYDISRYVEEYHRQVLNKLDAFQVVEELGIDSILLCYEKPDEFCHRHLVSAWLRDKTGIEIEEYSKIIEKPSPNFAKFFTKTTKK